MDEQKAKVGRPVHVAEYVEGKEAAKNFVQAVRSIMAVPKKAILDAEQAENHPKEAKQ